MLQHNTPCLRMIVMLKHNLRQTDLHQDQPADAKCDTLFLLGPVSRKLSLYQARIRTRLNSYRHGPPGCHCLEKF
jgi:hypothetical protein